MTPVFKEKTTFEKIDEFNTAIAIVNKIQVQYKTSKFIPYYNLAAKQLDILKCCGVITDYILDIIEEVNENVKL